MPEFQIHVKKASEMEVALRFKLLTLVTLLTLLTLLKLLYTAKTLAVYIVRKG